jgi:curved DNA-binding protein CbpA
LKNYYVLLGISPGATEDQIKQAYLRLAKKYHPDKNNSPDATKKMAEINLAYETLCDSYRRKQHDLDNNITVLRNEQEEAKQNNEFRVQNRDSKYEEAINYVSCSTCGFVAKASDRFCSQCGAPFNHGRCLQCNFVNNSGTFVCLTCGYVFEPQVNYYQKKEEKWDEGSFEEPEMINQEAPSDEIAEIIRCPQCNEINVYSRGSCWHCGLYFEIDEVA